MEKYRSDNTEKVIKSKFNGSCISHNKLIDVLTNVLIKERFKEDLDITYNEGQEKGKAGFVSASVSITVSDGRQQKSFFIKRAKSDADEFLMLLYENENNFYEYVVPQFKEFQTKNGLRDFLKIPKCYGVDKGGNYIVIIEELTTQGYELAKNFNDEHILLVFETFAKLHAVSFAMRCKEIGRYKKLSEKLPNIFPQIFKSAGVLESSRQIFDVIIDEVGGEFQTKCQSLRRRMFDYTDRFDKEIVKDDYSVITHGDCWRNNIMFKYVDGNYEDPKDIRLVDFQLSRESSLVFDLTYFFYMAATKESLNKLNDYLSFYYDELSKNIRKFDVNPEIVYPKNVFDEEWRNHSIFGFIMSTFLKKLMLFRQNEVPDLNELQEFSNNVANTEPTNKVEYMENMIDLIEHFIENQW